MRMSYPPISDEFASAGVPGTACPCHGTGEGDEHNGNCMAIDREEQEQEYVSRCPVCGSPIDYCQGHGEMGDPWGYAILQAHDDGDHSQCDPEGCDERSAA